LYFTPREKMKFCIEHQATGKKIKFYFTPRLALRMTITGHLFLEQVLHADFFGNFFLISHTT